MPAFAGMTVFFSGMTVLFTCMTVLFSGVTVCSCWWLPAFAGMTVFFAGVTVSFAGVTLLRWYGAADWFIFFRLAVLCRCRLFGKLCQNFL